MKLHKQTRRKINTQSPLPRAKHNQVGVMCVFLPACRLLHSAEADVFISRGSGRENGRNFSKEKQIMEKRFKHTLRKKSVFHSNTQSNAFHFMIQHHIVDKRCTKAACSHILERVAPHRHCTI